jgi:hypothetical protein
LALLGLLAGILSGMFGVGGGVVIVPALTIFFGFELKEAVGTSLAVLILPVSFFAVLAYYRANQLQVRPAAFVALGLIVGSTAGAQRPRLPVGTLQRRNAAASDLRGLALQTAQAGAERRPHASRSRARRPYRSQMIWYIIWP